MLVRLERIGWLLGAVKLANVALAMLWGFVVTFVFVRLLPIEDFRGFLVLIAFANFTISADFGFSAILYARLRIWWLGGGQAEDFDPGETAMLFAFMTAIVLAGALLLAAGLTSGVLATGRPWLFLAFFGVTALNIYGLLARRALAAVDANLLWEMMDGARRVAAILLLVAALYGLPILTSVLAQGGLMVATLAIALGVVHRATGMRMRDWFLRGTGGLRLFFVRNRADMRATMLLTMADVGGYNAPYFMIAAATSDPRPLLLFDFAFKMSRALSAVIRALVETAQPRMTRALHRGETDAVRRGLHRLLTLSVAIAAVLGAGILVAGPKLLDLLYDGRASALLFELAMIAAMLLALSLICVSVYVHNGFGRFPALVPLSLLFLAGSLLSVVPAILASDEMFALIVLSALAAVHGVVARRHWRLMRGLVTA